MIFSTSSAAAAVAGAGRAARPPCRRRRIVQEALKKPSSSSPTKSKSGGAEGRHDRLGVASIIEDLREAIAHHLNYLFMPRVAAAAFLAELRRQLVHRLANHRFEVAPAPGAPSLNSPTTSSYTPTRLRCLNISSATSSMSEPSKNGCVPRNSSNEYGTPPPRLSS